MGKILINGKFVIDENLTLNGIAVELGQDAEIFVNQGVTFSATKSPQQKTQFYACSTNYWLGIENLGTVQFNEVIVENSLSGIFNRNSGRSRVEESCFNENDSHIVIFREYGTLNNGDNNSNGEGPIYVRGTQFRSDKVFTYRNEGRDRNFVGILYVYNNIDIVKLTLNNDFRVGISSTQRGDKNLFNNSQFAIALASLNSVPMNFFAEEFDVKIVNNIFRNLNSLRQTKQTYNAGCYFHIPIFPGSIFQKEDFPNLTISNYIFDNANVGLDLGLHSYSLAIGTPTLQLEGNISVNNSLFKNITPATPSMHSAAVSLGSSAPQKPRFPLGAMPANIGYGRFEGSTLTYLLNRTFNSQQGVYENTGGQHYYFFNEFSRLTNRGIESPDF